MDNNLFSRMNSIGISFQQYVELTKSEIGNIHSKNLDEIEKERFESRKLNLHRMNRIEKYGAISDELKYILQSIKEPQIWMIITETWCGDSSQIIPYIAKMAGENSKISLKIILRDENPVIMKLYLTNRTRSIPILVAFNEQGHELFKWGPRPAEAKKLFDSLTAKGVEKSIKLEKLHLWYGRNKGKNLELEFHAAIKKILGDSIVKEAIH